MKAQRLAGVACVVVVIACSGRQSTEEPSPVKPSVAEHDAGAKPKTTGGPMMGKPSRDPPPSGPQTETFELEMGEPHTTRDGLVISLRLDTHKQTGDGEMMGRYVLALDKSGEKETVVYDSFSGDAFWYMEGLAHGHMYTVEPSDSPDHRGYQVTLTPSDAKPVVVDINLMADPDHWAHVAARNAAESVGCEKFYTKGGGRSPGTLEYRSKDCFLLVGLYSRRVFYHPVDSGK